MALLQNLYILNMHCLVGSVPLPCKEILGDGIQDVRAEHLQANIHDQRKATNHLALGNTLSWKTSFVTGFVHFTIGMFMLMILNLFGLQIEWW